MKNNKYYVWCFLIVFTGISFTLLKTAYATTFQDKFANLEKQSEGRLGISAVDLGNNRRIQYHANERFQMGCTAKVIGVATLLKESMNAPRLLDEKVTIKKEDILGWAPVTEKHVGQDMTISEICAASLSHSDNTAMNLIVRKLGGLEKLNSFADSIGDKDFRVDNWWPEEAMGSPSDMKNSTTPAAMEQSLQRLAFGAVLTPELREQLLTWMKANTIGVDRIRAGVPKGWVVGDKTGTGFHYGITNDIAIIWPPKCAPIIVALYYSRDKKELPKREDVLAEATRVLIDEFARTDQCLKQAMQKL